VLGRRHGHENDFFVDKADILAIASLPKVAAKKYFSENVFFGSAEVVRKSNAFSNLFNFFVNFYHLFILILATCNADVILSLHIDFLLDVLLISQLSLFQRFVAWVTIPLHAVTSAILTSSLFIESSEVLMMLHFCSEYLCKSLSSSRHVVRYGAKKKDCRFLSARRSFFFMSYEMENRKRGILNSSSLFERPKRLI